MPVCAGFVSELLLWKAGPKDRGLSGVVGYYNASREEDAINRSISMERYRELLKDAGQVDCPLLARLGYPAILVHTNFGQRCIPAAHMVPVGNNPHNNRWATVAASRVSTGLAVGCVVGKVYVLRTNGKDLTTKEW